MSVNLGIVGLAERGQAFTKTEGTTLLRLVLALGLEVGEVDCRWAGNNGNVLNLDGGDVWPVRAAAQVQAELSLQSPHRDHTIDCQH